MNNKSPPLVRRGARSRVRGLLGGYRAVVRGDRNVRLMVEVELGKLVCRIPIGEGAIHSNYRALPHYTN